MGRKTGVLFSSLAIVLEIVTALFLTPLTIRKFGQAEYGVYSLVLSVVSYLSLLDLGVGNTVLRFMSKYRTNNDVDKQKSFLGIITVYYSIVVVAIIVISIVLYVFFHVFFSKGLSLEEIRLARKLLILCSLNIMVSIGTAGYLYTVMAFEKYHITKGISIIVSVFRIALSLYLLKRGARSVEITTVQFVLNTVFRSFIVYYVLCRMNIVPSLKNIDKAYVKNIFAYSSLIFLQMIAAQLNNMTDQILIGAIIESSSIILGIYAVGTQINHYYLTFGGILNGVLMPGVVRLVEKNNTSESIEFEMIRIGRYNFSFVGFTWVLFLLFGQQFVSLWSGPENSNAYYVALILMFPNLIILTSDIGCKILWALDKQKRLAFAKIIVVLINIGFTILLIKWNPLIGASIGTFLSLMIGDVFLFQFILKKELGISLFNYWKQIIKGILVVHLLTAGLGVLIRVFPWSGWWGLVLKSSLLLFVFICFLFWFGFNKTEKQYIFRQINRLIKRIHIYNE